MWRFFLGLGLLLALFGLCFTVMVYAQRTCAPLSDKLDQAAGAALSGDTAGALTTVRSCRRDWDALWGKTAAFTDHAPMDEIDSLFSQLEAYGASGNREHMAAVCARLSELVQAIGEAQQLSWRNFL